MAIQNKMNRMMASSEVLYHDKVSLYTAPSHLSTTEEFQLGLVSTPALET
jgi:hypothetical protein